jgi:MoxR-like ATPase
LTCAAKKSGPRQYKQQNRDYHRLPREVSTRKRKSPKALPYLIFFAWTPPHRRPSRSWKNHPCHRHSPSIGLKLWKNSVHQFHQGPIFNNIVLCDEINRATPKTQSALLEAMGEKQVTIEGKTYKLPEVFCVIATQNPVEQYGTFPLPESQLDRFMMKISIGYPSREAEKEILKIGSTHEELHFIEPAMDPDEVTRTQDDIEKNIYISDKILDYALAIIHATRKNGLLTAGLSTRGALTLINTAKTNAYFHGRDFVIPEDVKELAEYTIPHRVLFKEEYENINKREIIKSFIEEIPTPA